MKKNCFYTVSALTLIVYVIVLLVYYNTSQTSAIGQAELRTKDLLRHISAAKVFFNNDQKKKVELYKKDNAFNENLFIPEIYSFTYAYKQINNYYNEIRKENKLPAVTISFVAKNPKNDNNWATEEETKILERFNSNKDKSYKKVLETKKGTYLYYAKPVVKLKQSCLKCHGHPKDAPKALINKYGNGKGFHHKIGETRAFIKVLMPLDKYLNEAEKLFWIIAISTFIILMFILFLVKLFSTKTRNETKKFQIVIDSLDELILVKSNTNILSINKSFSNFFDVNSIEEFQEKYGCLSNHFIEEEGCLTPDLAKIDDELIEDIKKTEKTLRVVQVANQLGIIHTLSIKIDKLDVDEMQYVIVLSDITKLQLKAKTFEKKANIDTLTNIYSRSKFDLLAKEEFSKDQRYKSSLTLLFLDIDHFKNINDTYGHDIGDITLKYFAKTISDNIREFDVFARWGGEEFILMLPQTDVDSGYALAEKIRKLISTKKFEKIGGLTCSIGISSLVDGDTLESLIKRADNALYEAKNSGRDKTVIEA